MGSQRVRHDWATSLSLSQVVLFAKSPPVSDMGKRHMFDPWVRKILWRRAWQPTLVFLPGESTEEPCGQATVHRVAKSWTRLKQLSRVCVCLCVCVCVYQFSSVAQLCLTLCNSMDCSTPGFPVYYHLPELTQTHGHWVGDTIQPSHPLSSLSPAFNLSQHQGLFQGLGSLHQVAKVLEFQLQHQFFQWIFRTDFL